MAKHKILIEVVGETRSPFEMHVEATASIATARRQAEDALAAVGGEGIDIDPDIAPVPMLLGPSESPGDAIQVLSGIRAFGVERAPSSPTAHSTVVAAEVDDRRLRDLRARTDIRVWPNSEITLLARAARVRASRVGATRARTRARARRTEAPGVEVDCRPFRAGVGVTDIQRALHVDAAWNDGFRGQGIVVGIIDEGVNGNVYPVTGGFSRPASPVNPGSAAITSHGSMCAADVLIAAPDATLFDYPFLGIPNSGGALQMFQAVLDQRRADGTPHITNNSYGFVGVPSKASSPNHEVHDIDHPLHRKVREVIAAGVACFFAAGNCGKDCPSGNCLASGIGPGKSIHASNSLVEVITVAAVNSLHERIGYSSQGPGMFHPTKPDLACYSHIFGNFGPGRPGGLSQPFDNGTSAATPVAAGVAAMLLSAFGRLDPATLKMALIASAIPVSRHGSWDRDFGHGVGDAGAAYALLNQMRLALA